MATTRDSIADIWGPRTPQLGSQWPVRVDQNVDEDPDRWVQACCFLCSNGCGIDTQRYLNVTDEELRKGLEVSWINQGRPLRLASQG